MACFVVPAAEAVITTVATKVLESREKNVQTGEAHAENLEKLAFSRKLKWLRNLLWGGSGLLAFEHVWHGELLIANPADMVEMLREMATVGTGMAALVTLVWGGMVAVSSAVEKKAPGALSAQR